MGGNFNHGSFPVVGEKQKTYKKERKKKKKSKWPVHHHVWRMQAAWTKIIAIMGQCYYILTA